MHPSALPTLRARLEALRIPPISFLIQIFLSPGALIIQLLDVLRLQPHINERGAAAQSQLSLPVGSPRTAPTQGQEVPLSTPPRTREARTLPRESCPELHQPSERCGALRLTWHEESRRGESACSRGAAGVAERIAVPYRRRTSLRGPAPRAVAFIGCGPGPAVNQRRRGAPPARSSAAVTRPPAAPSPPGRPPSPTCGAMAARPPALYRPASGRCGRRAGSPEGAKGRVGEKRGEAVGAGCCAPRLPAALGTVERGRAARQSSPGGGARHRARPGSAAGLPEPRSHQPCTSAAEGLCCGKAQPSSAQNPLLLNLFFFLLCVGNSTGHRHPVGEVPVGGQSEVPQGCTPSFSCPGGSVDPL